MKAGALEQDYVFDNQSGAKGISLSAAKRGRGAG